MKNGFTWAWQYSCLIVCGLSVEELAFLGAECNYYNNAISTCLPLPLAPPFRLFPAQFSRPVLQLAVWRQMSHFRLAWKIRRVSDASSVKVCGG